MPDQLPLFQEEHPSNVTDDSKKALLALARVRGLGEVSLKKLLDQLGDLAVIWHASADEVPGILRQAGVRSWRESGAAIARDRSRLLEEGERELDRLRSTKAELLFRPESRFPESLRRIATAPHWIFAQGNQGLLYDHSLIAVVGTRQPSDAGIGIARQISSWLALNGFGIVSGLAEGIDEIAHQTALDLGAPSVAVLGTGINVVFPSATGPIRERLLEKDGLIVTEYLPYDSYSRSRFVRRNRLQAALASAVVPVQAAAESGTAHTYRFAKLFNKVIFGVNSARAPQYEGLINTIVDDGYPIFIVDSERSLAELSKLLAPFKGRVPRQSRYKLLFGGVIDEFRRVRDTYEVTRADVQRLTKLLNDEIEKGRPRGEGNRD